jgi:hypothetical protein
VRSKGTGHLLVRNYLIVRIEKLKSWARVEQGNRCDIVSVGG